MDFEYAKLKGRIKEIFETQDRFAEALGIGRVSLSKRLTNKLDFSQTEINRSAELLSICKEEIPLYFFTEKVQKNEQLKAG
jgi:hypothetical protein